MAITAQKLLPQSKSGAIVPMKRTAITRITPIANKTDVSAGESKDTLVIIKERCIEINTLLKGSLALDKIRADKQRKKVEQQKRAGQEDKLESNKKGKEEKGPGLSMPKIGFLDRMKNFIKNVLLGFILVRLVEFAPILQKIIPVIAGITEFISDVFLGIIDGLGTFLAWGFTAWESSEEKLKEWGGDEAVARLNELGDTLGDLFNAIAIVGMVAARMSPKGTKNLLRREAGLKSPKVTPKTPLTAPQAGGRPGINPTGPRGASRAIQLKHGPEARAIYDNARANGKSIGQAKAAVNRALRSGKIVSKPQFGTLKGDVATPKGNIMKKGLRGSGKRLGLKLFGKAGLKTVKGVFGRIPILGPIVVAVASLLAGEPIGQALFKGVGAALGGLLGSFIPIPVIGTLLGETLGTFVGDVLYSLILGGGPDEALKKLGDAIKTAMDVGGLVVNFFKEGFGRFFKNFPTVDVPEVMKSPLGALFPFLATDGAKGFFGEKQVTKMPNLSILFNPFAMLTELIPHAAKSFFPAIFGEGGTAFGGSSSVTVTSAAPVQPQPQPNQPNVNPSVSGGGYNTTPSDVNNLPASKKGKIYLHWTAGDGGTAYPNRYHTTILADGSKVQEVPYTQFNTPGGHTAYRNSEGVGLSIAAMAGWNWSTIKPAQLDALTSEAAKVAKDMGYSKSMINVRNVATHAEVGSMKDGGVNTPPMAGAKTDPDNYGPAWPGWGGDGTRSDFIDINKADYNAQKGVGGDKLRAMIKAKMRLGGPTMGRGLYLMGEEGKEFVIDADSTRALQGTFPGLLKALNKAQGDEAINVLRSYAEYEMGEVIPVPVPIKQPVQQTAGGYDKGSRVSVNVTASKKESFSDILYMR